MRLAGDGCTHRIMRRFDGRQFQDGHELRFLAIVAVSSIAALGLGVAGEIEASTTPSKTFLLPNTSITGTVFLLSK